MHRILRRLLLLAPLFLVSACASIVEGSDQSVTVMTDPSGAVCKLERAGTVIAVVNPTPGSARIGKSKENVSVLCEKQGHQTAAAPLASEFQGMTFGNIIFGGLIGVAVDAGTGAMNKYPESVTVLLPPNSFATTADRDAFYEKVKARTMAESAQAIEAARRNCSPDAKAQCELSVKEIEAKRDAKLREIEGHRLGSRIG